MYCESGPDRTFELPFLEPVLDLGLGLDWFLELPSPPTFFLVCLTVFAFRGLFFGLGMLESRSVVIFGTLLYSEKLNLCEHRRVTRRFVASQETTCNNDCKIRDWKPLDYCWYAQEYPDVGPLGGLHPQRRYQHDCCCCCCC